MFVGFLRLILNFFVVPFDIYKEAFQILKKIGEHGFHKQDGEYFNKPDSYINRKGGVKFYLTWGSKEGGTNTVAAKIISALESEGVATEWDGSSDTRIGVKGMKK